MSRYGKEQAEIELAPGKVKEKLEAKIAEYVAKHFQEEDLNQQIANMAQNMLGDAVKGFFGLDTSFGRYELKRNSPLKAKVEHWYETHDCGVDAFLAEFELSSKFKAKLIKAAVRAVLEEYEGQFIRSLRKRARIAAAKNAKAVMEDIGLTVDKDEVLRRLEDIEFDTADDIVDDEDEWDEEDDEVDEYSMHSEVDDFVDKHYGDQDSDDEEDDEPEEEDWDDEEEEEEDEPPPTPKRAKAKARKKWKKKKKRR